MWCKRLPSQVTVTFLKVLQRTCCTCKKAIETATCDAMVTGQPVIEHEKNLRNNKIANYWELDNG